MSDQKPFEARRLLPATDKLVVCEGEKDYGFLLKLIETVDINDIECWIPSHYEPNRGGWDAMIGLILSLSTSEPWKQINSVLVVGDADTDKRARFDSAKGALSKANFSVNAPYLVTVTENKKAAVYLMPNEPTPTGCSEHLFLEAIGANEPHLIECVDNLIACVSKPGAWLENQEAKMRIQILLSACCRNSPDKATLKWAWRESDNPIPIYSSSYDMLVSLLRSL